MTSWMKKLICGCASVLVPLGLLAADVDQEAILRKIDAMQRQIAEQQAAIEALRTQLQESKAQAEEQVSALVDEAVQSRGLAAAGGGAVFTAPEWIENINFIGSLRLRYEYVERDAKSDSYSNGYRCGCYGVDETEKRFQTLFRLGIKWTAPSENWEVAAGLVTGMDEAESDSSYYGRYGSSMSYEADKEGAYVNDSWNQNSPWESGAVWFDYIYAKHTWDAFSLMLGQTPNPFVTTWMMFDPDLRPTGATAMYSSDMFFATIGAYNLQSDATTPGSRNDSLANMYAGQLGVTLEAEPVQALVALSYYHYDNEVSEAAAYGWDHNNPEDYDYEIGALYAEVKGTVEEVALKAYGEVAMNFGADKDNGSMTQLSMMPPPGYDAEDGDLAWIAGAEVGAFGLTLGYAYCYIEGDSIPWFAVDNDWATGLMAGTNVEGHRIGISYDVTKHCSVGATAILTQWIEDSVYSYDDGEVYQFDVNYRF
jgi:hypothetical protein